MSFKFHKKISNFLISKIDYFVIKYLTVERGRNRRKYIWKTKNFREITQLHIPRLLFVGFGVVMCWKINEKVKSLHPNNEIQYTTKSKREESIEKEEKVN
jgi:hypothetical protein